MHTDLFGSAHQSLLYTRTTICIYLEKWQAKANQWGIITVSTQGPIIQSMYCTDLPCYPNVLN